MRKKFMCGVIAAATLLMALVPTLAQGLLGGVEVKDFAFQYVDAQGRESRTISAGGTITANVKLENNTNSSQSYSMILQVTDKGKKIAIETVEGTLPKGEAVPLEVSYTFSVEETDFSGYQANVFLWSDMNRMQPLSMKADFFENNTRLYGFRVDGEQLARPDQNNEASFAVDFEYTGIPKIIPIAENLGTEVTGPDVAVEEPTEAGQRLTYTLKAANGETQQWYLNLYRSNPLTDPRNADANLVSLDKVIGINSNNNHSATPMLTTAFDPDVTEYTVLVIDPVMADAMTLKTVNPDAAITQTASAKDTLSATNVTADSVYEVTSADGSVKKEYTFTYQLLNKNSFTVGSSTYSLAMKNGIAPDDAGAIDLWHNSYSGNLQGEGTLMAGYDKLGSSTIKKVRTVFEVDVTGIPDNIQNASVIIPFTKYTDLNTATNIILNVYKAELADGVTMETLEEGAVYQSFTEQLATFPVTVTAIPGNGSDAYIVPIDKDELLALKAAGENLYIGVEIDEKDRKTAEVRMKKPKNDGWASPLYVRINYN